ncbi:tetratricopeptide repeat protein [Yoonia sp. R2331]|uniref:tetratricopeptide repeat protein n=1 Tax=Yoonia sp. R2331 TaxID=3237238 RepID=UPI0034E50E22
MTVMQDIQADPRALQILYQGRDLEVLYLPGRAAYALVSFDIMHARANGRTGFALKLARKNDIPLFAVVPRRPHWYPRAEAEVAAKLIAAAKDRPTIGYGASMGGYGVLKYGRLLNTDATLAFSPQISIDPGVTGAQDRRYGRFYDAAANGEMAVTPSDVAPNSRIIYDPIFAPDRYQQGLLAPDVATRIGLPHMGHRAIATMTGSDNAMAVFAAALAGDDATIRNVLRGNRSQTRDYYQGLAGAVLARGRPQLALSILQKGAALADMAQDTRLMRARIYSQLGQAERAIALVEPLIAEQPHQVMFKRVLVDVLEQAGQTKQAIAVLQEALAQSPNAVLAIRLSRLLHQTNPRKAKAFDVTARATWPAHADHFAGQVARAPLA